MPRKAQDVFDACRAKAVDRLCIVTHHADADSVRLHRPQNFCLQGVRVLVFIYQHMRKRRTNFPRQLRLLHQDVPVEQQIVVVEQVLLLLDLHVVPVELRELTVPLRAPGEHVAQRVFEQSLGVDAVRIDRQAGIFARKALFRTGQVQLLPRDVHQICGVAPIDDGELGAEAELAGVLAQESRADRVKRSRP